MVSALVALVMVMDPAKADDQLKTAHPWLLGTYWQFFGLHIISAFVIGGTLIGLPIFRAVSRRRGRQEPD